MSDLDSSLLLSSSGCSSREAVLLQHPPLDQVADQDDVDEGDDETIMMMHTLWYFDENFLSCASFRFRKKNKAIIL